MATTLRTLRFYLCVGLVQGALLLGVVLSGALSDLAIGAACAAVLMGGGMLQLVPERRSEWRTWWALMILALVTAGLVMACRGLPLTSQVLGGVATGLILLTVFCAAALHGRADLGRRFCTYVLWVLLALPMPWIAQAAFKRWTSSQHLDPFKDGWLSLVFFAGPTLALSIGLFLISLCLVALQRRRSPVSG
ncbi:hypothetical protein GV819_24665 [Pseudomonas sp. Fl5BN2]|uniref:hypothetical protein n=1 Tax=Pseudomonas sp. Fl5BN2 TaxID=2697652 RepID=UPI001377E658|nr:hypothetical protein [Pseudomonas sp. Fl5BN2]NBF05491.1 hypothetical protein [Pseudomonas sp. Fl5BN2]